MDVTQKFSYALEKYIHDRVSTICDMNAADHRPTSQWEIDEAIKESIKLHEAGEALILSLTADEIRHCRALYRRKREYGADDLVHVRLLGRWVVVPRYITYIEEARDFAKIFAP